MSVSHAVHPHQTCFSASTFSLASKLHLGIEPAGAVRDGRSRKVSLGRGEATQLSPQLRCNPPQNRAPPATRGSASRRAPSSSMSVQLNPHVSASKVRFSSLQLRPSGSKLDVRRIPSPCQRAPSACQHGSNARHLASSTVSGVSSSSSAANSSAPDASSSASAATWSTSANRKTVQTTSRPCQSLLEHVSGLIEPITSQGRKTQES